MKRIVLLSILSISLLNYAQNQSPQFAQNELKLDIFDALVLKTVEVSYEHYLNEESSVGISAFVNFEKRDATFRYNEKTMFTPYFRQYFSNVYNWNFFGEVFFAINSGERETLQNGSSLNRYQEYTDGALGIAIGSKYISSRGFVIDIHGGLGRNLFNSDSREVVPRVGLNVGYQF